MRAPWDMNLHVLKVEKSKNVHERVTIKGDSKQQQSIYIYIYMFLTGFNKNIVKKNLQVERIFNIF
jgi:hypothetical protein